MYDFSLYSFHSRLTLIAPSNPRNPPNPPRVAPRITLVPQPSESATKIRGNNPKTAAIVPRRNPADHSLGLS